MDLRGLKNVEINSWPQSMILFIRPQKRHFLSYPNDLIPLYSETDLMVT
jgi:hypothetical protein